MQICNIDWMTGVFLNICITFDVFFTHYQIMISFSVQTKQMALKVLQDT